MVFILDITISNLKMCRQMEEKVTKYTFELISHWCAMRKCIFNMEIKLGEQYKRANIF